MFGVLILILGILGLTLTIIVTPTFASNYLSQDHNISDSRIVELLNYRLISGFVGGLLIVCGLLLLTLKNLERVEKLLKNALNTSPVTWVILGFSISYLLFFVFPIFMSAQVMQFPMYLPAIDPIGIDLDQMLFYSESLFIRKQTPYVGSNLYPPLASILFGPLLTISISMAYRIITLINVFCFAIITYLFPLKTSKNKKASSLLILFFITGILSYGFQFELERGQFNVIAISLCFLAIRIFHFHFRYRYLAYFLFTLSVQLKVFPLIFIVMLISNWQDWINNIKRLLMLGVVNISLLFVLGPHIFVDFINAIAYQISTPYIWIGNHSIRSFIILLFGPDYKYSGLIQIMLLAIVAFCILLVIYQAYRNKQKGINFVLLLACTLGALLIPSVSHDYTLSILVAPVTMVFMEYEFLGKIGNPRLNKLFIVLLLIFSITYSSTLFSYTYAQLFPFSYESILTNKFPALFIMLLATTLLSLMLNPIRKGPTGSLNLSD